MRYLLPLAIMLSIGVFLQAANAGPVYSNITANASLQSYLSSYGVSNSVVSGSSYHMMQYNGSQFIIVNETTGKNLLLRHTNGSYSFVLNPSLAYSVMEPYFVERFLPGNSVISYLNDTMNAFISASSGVINDCLLQTGIKSALNNSVFLCNASSSLSSITACMQNTCQHVPICGGALPSSSGLKSELQNFGVPSFFATGVQNFSISYGALNSSYTSYFSQLYGITPNNIASRLSALSGAVQNISRLSISIPQNPLFPPPVNASPSYLSQICSAYAATSSGPWYCNSVNFCGYTSFNATKLSSINSTISQLLEEPLTYDVIMQRANATVAQNNMLYAPKALEAKFQLVTSLKNATAALYNSTVLNASELLLKLSSAPLSSALANVIYAFQPLASINASANVIKLNDSAQASINAINITELNSSIRAMISKLQPIYRNASGHYDEVYSLAQNNTALLLAAHLDYQGTPPQSIATLSQQQQQVNMQLNSKVNASQLSSIANTLAVISSGIGSLSTSSYTLAAFVKGIDSGLITMLESSPTEPLQAKTAAAPAYAALISLVIGLIILGLLYEFTYARLKRNKKIKLKPSVHRAWTILFGILFIIVLAYVYETYALASSANSFLPATGFVSALMSSNYVSIAVNGSSSSQMAPCGVALQNSLGQRGKTVQLIYVTNDSCTSGQLAGPACLNSAVSKGPVIMLSMSNQSYVSFKGMYGNILYAGGTAAYGASCPLASLLKSA